MSNDRIKEVRTIIESQFAGTHEHVSKHDEPSTKYRGHQTFVAVAATVERANMLREAVTVALASKGFSSVVCDPAEAWWDGSQTRGRFQLHVKVEDIRAL